jgi:hypothetical protein
LVLSLIVNNKEHPLREQSDTGASSSIILEAYTSAPFIKTQMTVIQPPEVQWVVSLLQLKLGYACDLFIPRVKSQETNVFLLGIYADDLSESSNTYDMIIVRDLLGELGIIMNFNDHTVT